MLCIETTLVKAVEKRLKIENRLGLHARPAALVAQLAGRFQAEISIVSEENIVADAKSILSILMLGASCGSELRILAEGIDASAALEAIKGLFDGKFDED